MHPTPDEIVSVLPDEALELLMDLCLDSPEDPDSCVACAAYGERVLRDAVPD